MYNDLEIVQDINAFRKLTDNGKLIFILAFMNSSLGIDPALAQHIAHLFVRDPVILFEEKLHLDDTKAADHFEVRESTDS